MLTRRDLNPSCAAKEMVLVPFGLRPEQKTILASAINPSPLAPDDADFATCADLFKRCGDDRGLANT